jgi:glycosyltransferase involved in cell wall biosynthesis
MSTPILSVIIPTWDRANWICEAIDSALQQGPPGAIEVIVIDDGSTDNTAAVLRQRYQQKIVYRRLAQRKGVSHARNLGVAMASGELLAFLDSDDIWLPGKLDAERDIFNRYPQAEVVISDSLNIVESVPNQLSRFQFNGLAAACQNQERWNHDCDWLWTNCTNGIATCSITLRRHLLTRLACPLFSEDLISCEDWELEINLYQHYQVRVIPRLLSHIRCFVDATRTQRAAPNTPRTEAQTICLLQNRRTVMERTQLAPHLSDKLSAEFARILALTNQQLRAIDPSYV